MNEDIFGNEDDFAPINNSGIEKDDFEAAEDNAADEPDEAGNDAETAFDGAESEENAENEQSGSALSLPGGALVKEPEKEISEPEEDGEKKKFHVFRWLMCAVFVWIVLTFCFSDGFFASRYRENFKNNISMIDDKLGISKSLSRMSGKDDILKKKEDNMAKGTTYDNESYLLPYENAGEAAYGVIEGQLCAAKSNNIEIFASDGSKVWESATSVVNPIMSVEGKYIAIGESGGTKINLFADKKLVFSADCQNEILNINVSANGDVVAVTKKELYKGAVEVYNKSGEQVYGWVSGKDTIVCADISPSGRRLAVGFIDTSAAVKGSIQFFNIKNESSYKTVEVPDTVICSVDYSGETLSVLGDNRFIGLGTNGSVLWDETYPDGNLLAYAFDENGNKALLTEKNNIPVIRTYSKGGGLKNEISTEDLPDYIGISGSAVLYNNARMICFGKGSRQKKFPASMDVKRLIAVSGNSFAVIYNNSIEFFKS